MKRKINTKNLRCWLPKWSQNGAKKSKSQMVVAPFLPSKKLLRFLSFFCLFGLPLGSPLASFFALFGSRGLLFGSLSLPLGFLLLLFVILSLPFGSVGFVLGPQSFSSPAEAKFWRDLAKILPRLCQECAENLTRISQDPRRMNLKQSCLSNCKFFETTSFGDERFHKIA